MKGKKARNKLMQGNNKAQMEAGTCKKSSKKVPVLWLVVVPKCQKKDFFWQQFGVPAYISCGIQLGLVFGFMANPSIT